MVCFKTILMILPLSFVVREPLPSASLSTIAAAWAGKEKMLRPRP